MRKEIPIDPKILEEQYSIEQGDIYSSAFYPSPEDLCRLSRIKDAINTILSSRQKQVIDLHFYQNHKITHIAHTLNISRGSIYMHLKRGIRKLTQFFNN